MIPGGWRLGLAYPALCRLPFPLAMRAATLIGRWDRAGRANAQKAVQAGLLKAFPDLASDRARLEAWTKGYLELFAREAMDVFFISRLDRKNAERFIRLKGLRHLEEARAGGRGVILVLNHYSRVIMIPVRLGLLGVRMSMLTMRVDEKNPDLTPFMRSFLEQKIERLIKVMGGRSLALGSSLRPIYDGLSSGQIWIILSDAYMPQFGKWREFSFLGGRLRLPSGIERIAARTGARLVYGVTVEAGPALLECELRPLPERPEEALAAAVSDLEKDVLACPWQWWQWNILDYIWSKDE